MYASLFSQNEFIHFDTYSIEHGLSDPYVNDIIQDKEGFIWIATSDGLNRFDGKTFKIFRNQGINSNEISQNNINVLGLDRFGNLWIGETNGVDIFNPYTETFINYQSTNLDKTSNATPLTDNNITAFSLDANGDMWVGTSNGLNRFNHETGSFTQYFFSASDETSINDNSIQSLYLSKDNVLWIGTKAGLARYNPASDNFERFGKAANQAFSYPVVHRIKENKSGQLVLSVLDKKADRGSIDFFDPIAKTTTTRAKKSSEFRSIPEDAMTSIAVDKRNNYWFGTLSPSGLNRYSAETKTLHTYRQNDRDYATLSNDDVRKVFIDYTGIIWIGTAGGGVTKIRYEGNNHFLTMTVHRNKSDEETISNSQIISIYEDADGLVWYGTVNGLNRYTPSTKKVKRYFPNPNKNAISSNVIQTMLEDDYGNFWVGTKGGLDLLDRLRTRVTAYRAGRSSRSLAGNDITTLVKTRDNIIWVGTTTGLSQFNPSRRTFKSYKTSATDSTTISHNNVQAIAIDNTGLVWVGTKNGLNKFDPKTNTFTRFYYNKTNINSLSNNSILSLHVDVFNNLWVGTENGLSRFNKSSNNFTRFTIRDGLPNMRIYGIVEEDGKNRLWLSTNKGLSRFEYERSIFTNYSTLDGLVSNDFNQYAYHKGRSKRLYFGTSLGSVEFFPSKLVTNRIEPKFSFSGLQVKNKADNPDSGYNKIELLDLEYDQSSVSFEIAVLDFTAPEKNAFEYWMEGVDNGWIPFGGRYFVPYNLNPNDYLFKVRARNNDGIWSTKIKQLKIVVHPPLWDATWFRALVSTLIIGLISFFIYMRMKAQRDKEAILEKEVFQRTKELRDKTNELEQANVDLENEIVIRRDTESALRSARQETDSILANVNQGLFLLNAEFEISNQYSAELENIFGKKELAKTQFVKLMKPLITHKSLEELNDYIELLFNEDIDELAMQELNPLDRVELHFEVERGEYQTKHLAFSFRRIIDKSKINNLLVTARDITEVVELQEQLKRTESKNKTEMEQLLAILRANPNALRDYLKTVDIELIQVSRLFQEEKGAYRSILEKAFRIVHNLKGNASMLDLEFFVVKFHEIEEIMSRALDKAKITGDDFLPIILEINEINSYLDGMNDLIDRVIAMSGQFTADPTSASETETQLRINLKNVLEGLTEKLEKQADLRLEYKADVLPEPYKTVIRDISIQLIRNSMIHGIEDPETRIQSKKSSKAHLQVSIVKENGTVTFNYKDDGQGLDLERIKEKALRSGKYSKEKLQSLKNSDIAKLIFKDGFTTLDQTSQIGGRGEGMSLIKDLVGKNNGKMKFSFSKGQYFELGVVFPLN
jgi:ligand-binding sensor domain-containing protein/PAS domain-containing protein